MDSNNSDFDLIKRLTETPGIPGHEENIRVLIHNEVKEFCDEIIVDKLGNLICVKKGSKDKPKILLCAHMDTIGFMIKYIDSDGFLRIQPVGGIDPRITIGQPILIFHEENIVNGVIASKPIHLLEKKEREKVKKIDELHVDIGAKSKEDALEIISLGDFGVFNYSCKKLSHSVITSGGLDDRAGCMVLIKTLKELKDVETPNELYFIFSVQEEIGARGAITSAFNIDPDIGIVVEVAHGIDVPGLKKDKHGDISLGKGPAIDMGPNVNPKLFKYIIKKAENGNISFQLRVHGRATPTDLRHIQITHTGVSTALISVPLRYMHTTIEVMDLKDINRTVKLLIDVLSKLKKDINLKL
ncbi:MAG: M20/M25/M40 family metallo-hydrolase [Candidatus Lokiarchaeota archaeon]|nr:M20/M25/M40 family metallo-hydrolase [Candidatus Lokiarchaeota archaeon]